MDVDDQGRPRAITGDHGRARTNEDEHGRARASADEPGRAQTSEDEPSRAIEAIGEVWRVDDEWWRQPISRRYFDTVLEGGRHVVLYQDLTTNHWWMQQP